MENYANNTYKNINSLWSMEYKVQIIIIHSMCLVKKTCKDVEVFCIDMIIEEK